MAKPVDRWPEIKRLVEEAIEELIWNDDPPEIKKTLARLKATGFGEAKARELVERIFVKTCLERNSFDRERFIELLNELQ